MSAVPYEQQTFDRRNPIARFAHRTRMRKSKMLVAPYLTGSATMVDYGCGQGRFLGELAVDIKQSQPGVSLLGYDPYMSAKFEGYQVVSNIDEIAPESVDVVTSLEVCEHLSDDETQAFIDFVVKVMKPTGKLLVTVPIEIGPVLLVKELSRSVLHRRRPQMPFSELIKGTFLCVPPTRAEDRLSFHTGYDWRATEDMLLEKFDCDDVEFSPFPYRSWWGQSQVMMTFSKRA
jgi:2-polyprenyl-3-methyl-5-hydroxy-6-metoxy-1,4-benzoquinol methylase